MAHVICNKCLRPVKLVNGEEQPHECAKAVPPPAVHFTPNASEKLAALRTGMGIPDVEAALATWKVEEFKKLGNLWRGMLETMRRKTPND